MPSKQTPEEYAKQEQLKQNLSFMEEYHTDQGQKTLAQGELNGKWYFGKSLNGKKPLDSVLIEDGTYLINKEMLLTPKEKYSEKSLNMPNEIAKYGFITGQPLITKNNFMSEDFIKEYSKDRLQENKSINKIYSEQLNRTYYAVYKTLLKKEIPEADKQNLPDLIRTIQDYYMDLTNQELTYLTTNYVLSTYVYELFDAMGYLFMSSDPATGKTKWANILKNMSFNSVDVTSPSESVLFRLTESSKGLLFIDDYDKVDEKKKAQIEQILKVGYRKGGKTCRTEKIGDLFLPTFFDVYCPKIITNTEGLDYITETRCIPLHLLRTKTNKGKLSVNNTDIFWQRIRDCCYLWAFKNWKTIKKNYTKIDEANLNNRDLELIKPVLAVAKTNNEKDYNLVLKLAQGLFNNRETPDFSKDWKYLMFCELKKYFEDEYSIEKNSETYIKPSKISELMLNNGHFNQYDKAKPTPKWVGSRLTECGLFESKRVTTGRCYKISLKKIKEYMYSRDWITKEEFEGGDSNE